MGASRWMSEDGKSLRWAENPLRQDHVGQVGKEPRVGLGLAHAHQLDARRGDQLPDQRTVGVAEGQDRVHLTLHERPSRLGVGVLVQDRRRDGDVGRLEQIERDLPHAASLRADADPLAPELREVIERFIAPVKYPQGGVEHAAERLEVRGILRFSHAVLDKPCIDGLGLIFQAPEIIHGAC